MRSELDLKITRTVYWTDSMTVLKWVRSDARAYKVFVAHRIGEILTTTDVSDWIDVPTDENVADDATRDRRQSDLSQESRWFTGPSFLRSPEELWPQEREAVEIDPVVLEEKAVVMSIQSKDQVIDFGRYSSFLKMLRIVCICLRWKAYKRHDAEISTEVTVREMRRAETLLLKIAQEESFSVEMAELNRGKTLSSDSSLLQLEPYLDEDGLMRVTGRLGRGIFEEDFRHPIILKSHHPLTKLVIVHYHKMMGHVGQRTVSNELRQRYWILGAISALKRVSRECVDCQKRRAKPKVPLMADLPLFRMEEKIRPFSNCGLDFFGPVNVSIGRRVEKRWVALFTCLSVRAVHLEVAAGLDTDSAINAIVRMSARRGRPDHIYCDNGTNFHGAANELKKSLAELNNKMERTLATKGIQWHYNPPSAPHMGGVWERLVASVKRAMEAITHSRNLKEDTLHTVLCEAEWTVNCRPLTDVSVDPSDPCCLTPNHFLVGWSGGISGPEVQQPKWGSFEKSDLLLRRQYRVAQYPADSFWDRWRKEFLPSLTRRTKWLKTGETLKVGDVVVVVNDQEKRNAWPLGRIEATYPGKDGAVRTVEVKTAGGTYRRPAAKVCRLDIRCDEVPSSGGRMLGHQQTESILPEDREAEEEMKSGG